MTDFNKDVYTIARIHDNIFLGNIHATEFIFLHQNNIQAVLSLLNFDNLNDLIKFKNKFKNYPINHKLIIIEDSPDADISKHFDEIYEFVINNYANNKNILIHCQAGLSRSVSATAYCLMKLYGLSFEDALKLIQNKRPYMSINPSFVSQLLDYENYNNKTY